MGIKDIKAEARHKLALNVHQAIIVYTIEFLIVTALVALITLACMCLNTAGIVATIIMICYGVVLMLVALVGCGMADFAMVDYYLASYKCKPYNVRRLGETLARGGLTNILKLNILRTLLGFLLLLCLIVPGVVFFVRTTMANHLLIANPKMKAGTALKASNKVMAGRTGEYLALCCSFIGWWLLGLLTLGLGFVVISPYMKLAKTVYYKRKLQGDKAQYSSEPQPLSPQPSVPSENYAEGGFVPAPAKEKEKGKHGKTQPQNGGAPIDTLSDSDEAKMNAVARDVKEVVIPEPNGGAASPATITVESVEPVVVVEVNAENIPQDSGAFVETVKPMTTQEVMDADVTAKRFDELLFEDSEKKSKVGTAKAGLNDGGKRDAFDDFMSDFDVPKQDAEFKPLTRSSDSDKAEREQRRRPSPRGESGSIRDARSARVDNGAKAERADIDKQETETAESRADRLRRERQERIKNMRK